MLIGLTGSYCSGKDTFAEYLVKKKNFQHFSLSDELRKVLRSRNIDTSRENLIRIGTELRSKEGNGVLAKLVLAHVNENKNCVVTSIRHPAEVEALKSRKDFVFINVDAPSVVRFERMEKRKRPGDPQNFNEFLDMEKRESQDHGPGQQLKKTMALADIHFINDTNNLEQFHSKIDALLEKIREKPLR